MDARKAVEYSMYFTNAFPNKTDLAKACLTAWEEASEDMAKAVKYEDICRRAVRSQFNMLHLPFL